MNSVTHFDCARARPPPSQIVFVSSVAGLRKFPGCSVYGGSKWAVEGIAGSLREECKGSGVKVATFCPGSVATPWWSETERGGKPEAASQEALEKMLQPDDVAKALVSNSCTLHTPNLEPWCRIHVPYTPIPLSADHTHQNADAIKASAFPRSLYHIHCQSLNPKP